MGIEFTSNFDQIAKQIMAEASDRMHEAMAQGVAERAREEGMSTADNIQLELTSDSDDPELQIDADRVRARANEILAGD